MRNRYGGPRVRWGMKKRLLPLASLSLLVAALGACGTDDDGGDGGDGGVDSGPSESGLAAVELTDDLGCGYGFAVVDKDETTLLSIYRGTDAGKVARTVSLPDSPGRPRCGSAPTSPRTGATT